MQIHSYYTADPGRSQQIRDQRGTDRTVAAETALLPRVTKIGCYCGYMIGPGAAARVRDEKQLHQALVERRSGRLNHENVAGSQVFLNLYAPLPVRRSFDEPAPKGHSQGVCNCTCERNVA